MYHCIFFFVSLPRGEGEGGGGGKRAGGIWEGNTEEGRGRGERGTLKKSGEGGGRLWKWKKREERNNSLGRQGEGKERRDLEEGRDLPNSLNNVSFEDAGWMAQTLASESLCFSKKKKSNPVLRSLAAELVGWCGTKVARRKGKRWVGAELEEEGEDLLFLRITASGHN